MDDDDKTAHGKKADFEAMTLPHLDAAYNLARWLTRDAHDAEDLVQNAYLRAFRFYEGFQGGDARAWLMTIVRNTWYSALRDGRREREDVAYEEELHGAAGRDAGGIGADPASLYAGRDLGLSVDRALASLPAIFREVLVLKEMDELSYKEIAQVTDTPIGTVMSRLARARKLLAGLVKERMEA